MPSPSDRLSAAIADRYRIERELGQGGMATVYLAEDLKHKRKVALKVLKPELAAVLGAERFVQEITTTAALQHPHILPLFDSGTADGFLYYVMPFIDGETLRARLDRETQLGVSEAVRITAAVADALDYAHRRGVIHRDIKPENILLHEARPMVADFGIALAVSAAAGGRMTETGLSLGTPHYMSPEQATAEKDISARSDVYSLASVLYEMLAGQPPHLGGSAQQIIMRIVTDTARPVTELRKSVPPNVAAAVAKALEKLPADRFESAKDFGLALTDPAYASQDGTGLAADGTRGFAGMRMQRWSLLGWAAGVIGVALAAWSLLGARGESSANATVNHLSIVLPDTAPLVFVGASSLGGGWRGLAITPDGRTLVYPVRVNGVDQLYRRDLANFTSAPIPGTAGASNPFISPNGEWVGFFTGAELRKIPLSGGTPVPLAAVSEVAGATWAPDGRILVSAREGSLFGWVPEGGGQIQPIPNPQGVARTQPNNPLACGRVELGQRLFFDPRLSRGGETSCSTCHDPSRAFTDGRTVAVGDGGTVGTRNAPTLLGRAYGRSQFWDGRAATLEEQALQPFTNSREFANSHEEIERRLREDRAYLRAFADAFQGRKPSADLAALALASFVRTLVTGDSPMDRFLLLGDSAALTRVARRGFELFRGKAGCIRCHEPSLFTDETFHNTGITWRDSVYADPGRRAITGRYDDIGAFKTPTLRNVTLTAPYMHDGSLPTLEAVVEFYDRGGNPNRHLDPMLRPLNLTGTERSDLVAFLRALTGVTTMPSGAGCRG